MASVEILNDGGAVALNTAAGQARFHAIWLRDNAWDAETRAPGNGQRLIALRDIPEGTRVANATVENQTLTLTFSPEDREIEYDISWLMSHAYDLAAPHTAGWLNDCN